MASEEEVFYLRLSHLVLKYGTIAVRVYFDQELNPSCLGNELMSKKYELERLNLSTDQKRKLFPNDNSTLSSNNFDTTLMILLLRNLASLNISDTLPFLGNNSKEAAVSRIKFYRNQICHSNSGKYSEEDFHKIWDIIVNKSIGVLCPGMKQSCEDFKSSVLENSVMQRIENLLEKERSNDLLIQTYKELDIERKNLEEYQLQLKQSWKIKLQKFVLTKSTLDARKKFGNAQKLIVNGCQGSGKSAVAYHLAFFFEKSEGYSVIPLSSPMKIFQFLDKTRKQIFLFDDAFGKYYVEQSKLNKWEHCSEHFLTLEQNHNFKIILTCRTEICNEKDVQNLKILQTNVMSHTAHKEFSLEERWEICKMYISENDLSLLEDDLISMYPFLPWICSTYENTNSDIVIFFTSPRDIFTTEIERLKSHSSYFSLALLVLLNNKVEKKLFENDEKFQTLLKVLFEESECCQQPSKQSVISGFQNLKTMFIEETESYYHCIYHKVFDIIVHSVGSSFTKCMINNADPEIVSTRIMFERYSHNCNDNTILIKPHFENIYFCRLLNDLKHGRNWEVFGNIQCQYEAYRNEFLFYLGKHEKPYFFCRDNSQSAFYVSSYLGYYNFCKFIADKDLPQVLEATADKNNPFVPICEKGHVKIAALLLEKLLAVKKMKKDKDISFTLLYATGLINLLYFQSFVTNPAWYNALNRTMLKGSGVLMNVQFFGHNSNPLLIAIEQNNIDIITLFIRSRIGLNQNIKQSGTPLHHACTFGKAEITNMLIKHYANVNIKRNNDGFTPLHCSCRYGHGRIVKTLLKHGAKINILSKNTTPLLEACFHSNTDIVRILLQNGASTNKKGRCDTTPLYAAATIGNVEIIQLLLSTNTNVNITVKGFNPLHVACSKGHIAVVVELLKHCSPNTIFTNRIVRVSPLMYASSFGHADVVKVLLDEGADVNFVNEKGTTPIQLAVQNDFADVVEILLKHDARVNRALHVACKHGRVNLVKMLLQKCADVSEVDENGGIPLHETCGDQPEFPILKQKYFFHQPEILNRSDVNETCALGSTPLFVACLRGMNDIVKLLLEKGANVNQPCIDGLTPLCAACHSDTNINVEQLLKASAVVNFEKNKFGSVPLHIAVKTGNIRAVERLLESGAKVNKQSHDRQTALSIACCDNRVDIVKLLLKNNAKVNLISTNYQTPLDLVSSNGSLEIAELLLKHNASVNYGGTRSLTPLFFAGGHGHTDVFDLLLKWKASVYQAFRSKFTPLDLLCNNDYNLQDVLFSFISFWTFAHRFVNSNEYVILEDWLPFGILMYIMHARVQSRVSGQSVFLQMACSEGNQRMVEVLLKNRVNVNGRYLNGKSPLHVASQKRHMHITKYLLLHGAEINQEDEKGQTALHVTCEVGDIENAQLLIKKGAHIDTEDGEGQTPLYITAKNAHTDLMKYLLENRCRVNICCLNGRSALHALCATNQTMPVTLLLRYGSNINAKDNLGNSPLHISCLYGNLNVSELLMRHGAKLNQQNYHGTTPLHNACYEGNIDIVRLVLRGRANINIRDSNGETAFHFASMNGFKNIVTMLLEKRPILYKNDINTCLQICIDKKYIDIFEIINSIQIDIQRNNTFFQSACEFGNYDIAKSLLQFNVSVNAKGKDDKTPLFKASENNHLQIVELLCCHGADIDIRCVNGESALFVACVCNHEKIAEYLIQQRANIYHRNNENIMPYDVAFHLGNTGICDALKQKMKELAKPIDLSVYKKYTQLKESRDLLRFQQKNRLNIKTSLPINYLEIAKLFVPFEGLINMTDNNGRTPLHRACNEGRSEIVEMLLKNGATFSKDRYEQTELHFACSKGHEKIVLILLKKGAEVNQQDKNGSSPLHLTCSAGFEKVAEILIKANANMECTNNLGITPLVLAIYNNHENVFKILLKHGVFVNTICRVGPICLTPLSVAFMFFRRYMIDSLVDYSSIRFDINLSLLSEQYLIIIPLTIARLYSRLFNV